MSRKSFQDESFGSDSCIVCEVSDKLVSRCSGIDCLISFHWECLNAKLGGSEDLTADPSYCPYCWFKILSLKSASLRDKVIQAEMAVCKYLEKVKDTGHDDTTLSHDHHSVDIASDQEIPAEKASKEEQMQVDNAIDEVEASQDTEEEELAKYQTIVDTGVAGKQHGQVQQNVKPRRRRLILNATDSETSSDEQEALSTSPTGKMTNKERRNVSAATKVAMSKTVSKDQRRRLLWTPEEEEMLEVGVEIYAAEANKNIPWRKILEMGEKVFHETRTPTDLKDKWRNMLKAESREPNS